MIHIKTKDEIGKMEIAGKILAQVMFAILEEIKPGVSELEIDALAEKLILEKGGEPGFKKVKGYRHTICVATNEVVVHGIPGEYRFREGDVVCIDAGVYYQGYHSDMAETILVSTVDSQQLTIDKEKEKERFLEIGKKALGAGIAAAVGGNRIGDISKAIQDIVEVEGGYSVVRSLIGHGVGRQLHEEPEVPGFLSRPIAKTPELVPGMTIAIEVIYNMGRPDVVYANSDGWTIRSKDRSISAVFERTVLITEGNSVVLTK